jgi:2-dehydro-3-deoxygalactonokinase
MTQDIWIGIEICGSAVTGWRFDGTVVQEVATGPTEAAVIDRLGRHPALIVSESGQSQAVPAAALPDSLPLLALAQDRPRGWLDAAARLRIAGALARRQNWDGVICLPMGDVTHWCQISAGEVVSFQSALTPALALALGAAERADPAALADTLSRPERLSLHLRSATLDGAPAAVAGHLIGAELAAMRPYWLGQRVIVIAPGGPYADALATQGVPVDRLDPAEAASAGLVALRMSTR